MRDGSRRVCHAVLRDRACRREGCRRSCSHLRPAASGVAFPPLHAALIRFLALGRELRFARNRRARPAAGRWPAGGRGRGLPLDSHLYVETLPIPLRSTRQYVRTNAHYTSSTKSMEVGCLAAEGWGCGSFMGRGGRKNRKAQRQQAPGRRKKAGQAPPGHGGFPRKPRRRHAGRRDLAGPRGTAPPTPHPPREAGPTPRRRAGGVPLT